MGDLKQFCYNASNRVMMGLSQELGIQPGVDYKPTGYNASRVLSLRLVSINPAHLPKIRAMQNQLTFWAGLPDEYKVRVGHDSRSIIIEIPKPKTYWGQVTIEQLKSLHFFRHGPVATIGLGLQDDPKRINFAKDDMAHVLVSGQTRSGKTNSERLIAWNLIRNSEPSETKVLIFDVAKKGFKWNDFGNAANLAHPIITDLEVSDMVLSWGSLEIDRRAAGRYTTPKVFFVIDELKALVNDSNVASGFIARMAAIGGEFGLHLILSTQYPQINMLGNAEIKRNVTTRLCGKVDDAPAAFNVLGVADSGAESLQGYGDFLLKDFSGLSRLTIAHLQEKHVSELPRIDSVPILDLPDLDIVNGGAKPGRQPDEPTIEQQGFAFFNPMAINKLQKELRIGGTKASRLHKWAGDLREWARKNGYSCLPGEEFIIDAVS